MGRLDLDTPTWRDSLMRHLVFLLCLIAYSGSLSAQDPRVEVQGDSVRIWLQSVEIGVALQAFGRYLDRPLVIDPDITGTIPFFETPQPIPRTEILGALRGLALSQGLRVDVDSSFVRVRKATEGESESSDSVSVAAPDRGALFTVPMRHAQAAEVAAILNELYGAGPAVSSSGGGRQPRDDEEVNTGPLNGDVTIVPDALTNTLLIRALPEDFTLLNEAIESLDVRPLQVLIEVMLAEVRKDRNFNVGLSASLPETATSMGTFSGELQGAGLGDLVLRVMGLGKYEVESMLSLAQSRGEVQIRSRPTVVASNNSEATILVGTERPFVQVSRSLPTDVPQRDQVVQYREVGTRLTVTPTINREGYVTLALAQEMSSATGETQFDAPIISSRKATTKVLVGDGQTIVIGGLTDEIHDQVRTGIPFLSDIPLIGGLFGSRRDRVTETEIFIFITPTILDSDSAIRDATGLRMRDDVRDDISQRRLPIPDSLLPAIARIGGGWGSPSWPDSMSADTTGTGGGG